MHIRFLQITLLIAAVFNAQLFAGNIVGKTSDSWPQHDSVLFERVKIPNGKLILDGLLVLPNTPGRKTVVIFLGGSGEWEIADSYLKNPEESYGSLTRFYIEAPLMKDGV